MSKYRIRIKVGGVLRGHTESGATLTLLAKEYEAYKVDNFSIKSGKSFGPALRLVDADQVSSVKGDLFLVLSDYLELNGFPDIEVNTKFEVIP